MAMSDKDLSATMLGGSDMFYDFFCEPCSTDGQHLEAAGYCKTCAEYMCSTCFNAHRKSSASRTHILLDAATMPRTSIRAKPRDVLTKPCDKHHDKIFEYYCNADDDLCCTVCLNMQHIGCKDRAYIPDISTGVATGKEYKEIASCMDGLVAMATDETTAINADGKANDAYRSIAVSNIKSGRKEIDKLLDDAEVRAIQRVDELHKLNAEKIKTASQKCQSVLSEATTTVSDLNEKARAGKNNQLFVDVKLAQRRLPEMKDEVNQLKERKIFHYKFDKDNIIHHFMSTLSAMSSVTVTPDGAEVKARHVGDVNVKAADDSKDCNINGIVALPGDRLVVTDSDNNAIKLVDIKMNKITSRIDLSSLPLDVTRTRQDQVAVLGQEKKIEIFTVTDILTRNKTINLIECGFYSLCFAEDRFIVTVLGQIKRAVKIVDMTGRIVSTVYTDKDSDPLFKKPRYTTLDRSHDVLYITDYEANTVTCMTLRGRVIWVYKHAELKFPLGVAVGRGGDVIVCSKNTHTVQLVSRSGQLVQVLLEQQRGLAIFPGAICVCEDKLWVSSRSNKPEDRNYVRMFQLE